MKLLILTCLLALSLSASGLPLTDLPDFADLPVPWSDPSFPSNAYSIAIGNAPQDDVFENSADTLIGYWNPDINPLEVIWSPVDDFPWKPIICYGDPNPGPSSSPVPEPSTGATLVLIFLVSILVGKRP